MAAAVTTPATIEAPPGAPLTWPELRALGDAAVFFAGSWSLPAEISASGATTPAPFTGWTRAAPGPGAFGAPVALSPEGRQHGLFMLAASGGRPVYQTPYLYARESGVLLVRKVANAESPPAAPPAPPHSHVILSHHRGTPGLMDGLQYLAAFVREGALDELVIQDTRQVLARAPMRAPRGYPDPIETMNVLLADQKKRLAFIRDPRGTELMASVRALLCLGPGGENDRCHLGGDCDEQIEVAAARGLIAGIRQAFRLRWYAGEPEAHITGLYDGSPGQTGDWIPYEPSTESGKVSSRAFVKEEIMEVTLISPDAIPYVGIGAPPREIEASPAPGGREVSRRARGLELVGTMGAVADAQVMPTDLAAQLVELVRTERDALGRANEQLGRVRENLTKVRQDLGYPDAEPNPPLETGGPTPLGAYEAAVRAQSDSPPWTQQAQADCSKIQQTGAFLYQALGDALDGRRALFFHDNDVLIGSLAGDPIQIALVPNAAGVKVVTWIDPTNGQPLGSMGIDFAPYNLALSSVCPLMGVVFVVEEMDRIAQIMHLDVGQKLMKAANVVATTVLPPEQAKKITDAVANTVNAVGKTIQQWSDDALWWAIGLSLVGGVVLGVVASYYFVTYKGAAGKALSAGKAAFIAGEPRRRRRRYYASKWRHPEWGPTDVQTLILSKDDFRSRREAKRWAHAHGFRSGKVDETTDSYRLRQHAPSRYRRGTFRTITLRPGVKAVVAAHAA